MRSAADTTPAPAPPPAGKLSPRGKAGFWTPEGFTLLELMCVLLLLALILGLVLPSMFRTMRREQNRASLRELMSSLRAARSAAATSHRRVRLFLNLENGRYRTEGSPRQKVLVGLRLGEARLVWQGPDKRQGYIAFYGDGSSSGGYLTLTDSAGQQYVVEVEIITGRVGLRTAGG